MSAHGPLSHFEDNYAYPDIKKVWSTAAVPVAAEDDEVARPLSTSLDGTTQRIASMELSSTKQQVASIPAPLSSNNKRKKRGRDEVDMIRNLDPEKLKEALMDTISRQHPTGEVSTLLSEVMEQYDSTSHNVLYRSSPLKRQPFDLPQGTLSLQSYLGDLYSNAAVLTTRDYNEEFQAMKETLLKIIETRGTTFYHCFSNPDPQVREVLEQSEKLMEDFFYAAKTYTRIIVSEYNLPDEQKTIKPGRSGKYFHKGIVFRFAMDKLVVDDSGKRQWLYGGDTRNDVYAIKAAAKEFLALQMIISVDCGWLCCPMMAVIDYKGYRILVTPILPIDKTTIVYGSNDDGKTVHTSNHEQVNLFVKNLATRLRLKEHKVGTDPENCKMLCTPGSFQVHHGKDNRYYAVGFGRIFPPEAPCVDTNIVCTLAEKRSVLYKFLRPEFHLSRANEALSPDAFTDWAKHDENREENELGVSRATSTLFNQVIPLFAAEMEREVHIDFTLPYDALTEHILTRIRLITRARYAGVNMRHLGRVRANLQSEDQRKLLLSLCLARVVKRKLRDEMRRVQTKLKGTPSDLPFREVIVRVINTLLGHTKQSDSFWKVEMKKRLEETFHYVLSEEEKLDGFDLRAHIDIRTVLVGILIATGIIIKQEALTELMTSTYDFELLSADLMEIVPRVRIMNKFFVMRSKLLRLSALETKNQDTAARLLSVAYSICTNASFSAPKCPATCFEFSSLLLLLLKQQIETFWNLSKELPDSAQRGHNQFQDLCAGIEINFDVAFGRTEETIACIASSYSFLQWADIACEYANWKARFGYEELAKAYVEQSERIRAMGHSLQLEDLSLELCSEAKALALFRESARKQFDICSGHKCGRSALLRCTFRYGSFQDLICMGWRYS